MPLFNCMDDEDMDIGTPEQSASSLCTAGHKLSKRYAAIKRVLALLTTGICIFSFMYYQIPLFVSIYSDNSDCCYLYWFFYISTWYLVSQTIYSIFAIYLQCIVSKYYYNDDNLMGYTSPFTSQHFSLCHGFLFSLMRLFHLFAVSISSIYVFVYWILIDNTNHIDAFKNQNNPSDLSDIFNNLPLTSILIILQNILIPIIILIDYFTNLIYYEYKDGAIIFIAMFTYLVVLFIHYLLQYTNEFGDDYIYYFYDFNDNQVTSLIYSASTILIVTFWSLILIFIKRQLVFRWIRKNCGYDPINDHYKKDRSDAGSVGDRV